MSIAATPDLPKVTLLGWTMTEKQRAALLDGPDGPGLFTRAGFATPEAAAERYGRMEGWKLVSVMIGIIEQADELALCERMAGLPVSVSGDDGGQLGYLVRLEAAASEAGLELVVRSVSGLIEAVMLDADGVDWVKAHRTLDRVEAYFAARGVDLPPRPVRKPKSDASSTDGEPEGYPSK